MKVCRRANARNPAIRLAICFIVATLPIPSSNANAQSKDSPFNFLSPKPQSITYQNDHLTLKAPLQIIVGKNVSVENAANLRSILSPFQPFNQIWKSNAKGIHPIQVSLLHVSDLTLLHREFREMGVPFRTVPAREGYILMIGHDRSGHSQIVLAGSDQAGIAYGEQTLSQILDKGLRTTQIPAVIIKDFPAFSYRGIIEGFYGTPWSQADRMRLLTFCDRQKMNTFVYAPKDDPFHRNLWRVPYSPLKQSELRQLITFCKRHHMRFVFALSPGNTVSYVSDADLLAMIQKNQMMWNEGVRNFAIFFDDIGRHLTHSEDRARFGNDTSALAKAQASFMNRFYTQFIHTHPGAQLMTVPTDYYQPGHTPYRDQFAKYLNAHITVLWTGNGVIAKKVSVQDLALAKQIFHHPLLLWDNYPVNDYLPSRLFLGPLLGRDRGLATHGLQGILSNPMMEAEASTIALQTVADYAWNPLRYDAYQSWENALRESGGQAYLSLRRFALANRSSPIAPIETTSSFSKNLSEFFSYYRTGEHRRLLLAAHHLAGDFQEMKHTATELELHMENKTFIHEIRPWLRVMSMNASQSQLALEMLLSMRDGDRKRVGELRKIIQQHDLDFPYKGVTLSPEFHTFLRDACAQTDHWIMQKSQMLYWILELLRANGHS